MKTGEEHYAAVAAVVNNLVSYTNIVGQIEVKKVNDAFATWLDQVVRHDA